MSRRPVEGNNDELEYIVERTIVGEKELWEGLGPIPKRQFSILSPDPAELAEFITNNFGKAAIEAREPGQAIGLSIQFGAMPGLIFDQTTFTGAFDLIPKAQIKGLFFRFPITGSIVMRSGGRFIESSEAHATCIVSEELERFGVSSGSKHSQVGVVRSMCQDRLAHMFDRPVVQPIVFQPKVALTTGQMSKLTNLVHFLTQTDFGDLNMVMPTKATYLPHLVIDSILTCWPHNYSHLFEILSPLASHQSTKLALAYLEAHLLEMPSPDDLALVSGVSLRSLQYAFRNDFGLGIAEYQRRLRLTRAREELLRGGERVEDVARRWGFTNVGRFSREFHAVFGETPTQCRKRRHATGWSSSHNQSDKN